MMEALSPRLKELWNEWQLQILVLLSLTLQMTLIVMGNRRKYINKIWIKVIVWPAYLSADFVATAALGALMNHFVGYVGAVNPKLELTAFWAPFLLLHLGGPDTITAYSLEDNELWARHLLQLVVQTGFAFYIVIASWTGSYVSMLSFPMMVTGLIKYGERTWVLWSASSERRIESASSTNKMMKDLSSVRDFSNRSEDKLLQIAYGMIEMVKSLFAGVPVAATEHSALSIQEETLQILQKMSAKDAFEVIEMQLGFMYDILYTKAMLIYTRWGVGLRLLSFLLTSIVLIVFSLSSQNSQRYSKVDLWITFSLLGVAIVLELYAAFVLLLSDHALVWLRKHCTSLVALAIASRALPRNPRWSNCMGQYSLLSYFLKEKFTDSYGILKLAKIDQKLERRRYAAYQQVPDDLKKWLVTHSKKCRDRLKQHDKGAGIINSPRFLKGGTLQDLDYADEDILTFSTWLEFQQTIIVWHIATEICYHLDYDYFAKKKEQIRCSNAEIAYDDEQGTDGSFDAVVLNHEMSTCISRYMMYLLAISPHTLPASGEIGRINFQRTCEEARKELEGSFIRKSDEGGNNTQHQRDWEIKIQASEWLLARHRPLITDVDRIVLDGSLLSFGCKVADCLLEYRAPDSEEQRLERKWEAIAGVWTEILINAGTECRGSQHAQQLREGGEFLTHFWLLIRETIPLDDSSTAKQTDND